VIHRGLALAEIIDDCDQIIKKGFDMNFLVRVEFKRRLAKSAQVRAGYAIEARKIWNPGTPENL
jgi:hypothetical protein